MLPTSYRSLVPTVLLAVLAGCSPDQQQAASAASPAASASPVGAPAHSFPSLAARLAPHTATSSTGKQPAAPARKRGQPIGFSSTCGCLPPVPDLSLNSWPLSEDSSSAPQPVSNSFAPLSEQPADDGLAAFCAQAAPGRQVFAVRPGRDTVLLGQQGTRLVVPGRAFDVPAGSGPVQLELQEFYATPDIILANLSTASGPDLLETGGMLHLQATAAGRPVALRPGASIRLQLPTRERKPGMQLYQGVASAAHQALEWQLPGGAPAAGLADAVPKEPKAKTLKGDRWPCLVKGNGTLQRVFNQLAPLSAADLARVAHLRPTGRSERQERRRIGHNRGLRIRHLLMVSLLADSAGNIQKVSLQQGDTTLGRAIAAAARKLPPLRPASYLSAAVPHRRRPAAARGELEVLYTRDGQRHLRLEWLAIIKKEKPLQAFEGELFYELHASGLGWVNCDRPLGPGPRIQFAMQAPDPTTEVSLVFSNQDSFLASSRTEGRRRIFERVPEGAAVTVVALRRENGITYLATSSLNLSLEAHPALQFHPVSLAELRTALAQL